MHYNGDNSYLFVNGIEQFKFKANDSNIVANQLCLGNISKYWGATNMKKTGLFGYVYVLVLIMMLLTFLILLVTQILNDEKLYQIKCLDLLQKKFSTVLMILSSLVITITLGCISIIIVFFSIFFYNQHWCLFCLL